jgi:tetratricopeptide (TPR) repeat protein
MNISSSLLHPKKLNVSFGRFFKANRAIGLGIRIVAVVLSLLALQDSRLLVIPQNIAQGNDAFRQNNPTLAITAYRVALAAQPGDAYLLEQLVESATAAQRPDMAAMFLHELTSIYGWNSATYRKMADNLTRQAEPDQAAFYWQASLNGTIEDVPALTTLAEHALDGRDWATAKDILTRLVKLKPNNKQALYQLGLLLLPTDAIASLGYLEAVASDPQYAGNVAGLRAALLNAQGDPVGVKRQIGLALVGMQAWPFAERALTLALEQGDTSPTTLAFLGVVEDQQGRDGWPSIDRAFNVAPQDGLVNYAVALHWQLVGDLPKALTALSRAEAILPNNPAIAAEIAHVYELQGSLDNAAVWLNMATALAPENVGFRLLLANFYADKQADLAGNGLDAIRKIAEQYPSASDVHASLGWALYSTGKFDAARAEFDRALALDSRNARAHYYVGLAQEQQGDSQGAISSYLYVYRDTGDNPFKQMAAQALKRLNYNLNQP